MNLVFNELKATQTAYRFLVLGGRKKMPFIKLIKLLYLLDRKALLRWGRPVTTDDYVAMEHGPVVRRIYDLIKERAGPGIWHRHISPHSHDLIGPLTHDPGDRELSPAEEGLIAEVFTEFGGKHWRELVDVCHDLREWHKPDKGRPPIEVRDILAAGNKPESEIEEIVGELESLAVAQRLIAG